MAAAGRAAGGAQQPEEQYRLQGEPEQEREEPAWAAGPQQAVRAEQKLEERAQHEQPQEVRAKLGTD